METCNSIEVDENSYFEKTLWIHDGHIFILCNPLVAAGLESEVQSFCNSQDQSYSGTS